VQNPILPAPLRLKHPLEIESAALVQLIQAIGPLSLFVESQSALHTRMR